VRFCASQACFQGPIMVNNLVLTCKVLLLQSTFDPLPSRAMEVASVSSLALILPSVNA
jgi:hypothetical protein